MKKIAGTHLIVDGYVKDAEVFEEENMNSLFVDLVSTLGMEYLTWPEATPVPLDESKLSTDEDEGGTSFHCQITTSHIYAHTWQLRRAIMMDIFSCKPFNPDQALEVLKKHLYFEAVVVQVNERKDPKLDVESEPKDKN